MMFQYSGKLALVTGASSGIGREIARELMLRGASVIAIARRKERLQELQDELQTGAGNNFEYLALDLYNAVDQQKVIELLDSRPIDIVINNAGRGSFGRFDTLDISSELAMVELNVNAFMRITHAALLAFRRRKTPGALLGVSSIAAFQPLPYLATYAATKAFEYHLYRGLRAEVAGTGIHITCLNPGPVATEFAGVARVPGTVTGFNRDDARAVAKNALDALASNAPFVVPGGVSKLMALASRLLPIALTTFFTARSLKQVLEKTGRVC